MNRLRFLGASLVGLVGYPLFVPFAKAGSLTGATLDLDIFVNEFVPAIERSTYHPKWVRANPNEAFRWATYRDALRSGAKPEPPTMATYYGRALVAAGKMAAPEETAPPPPLPVVIYPHAGLHPSLTQPGI